MERILVADDGSDAAMCAVETAAELAVRTGAELFALAVVNPAEFRPGDVEALARSEALEEGGAIDRLVDAAADYLDRCRTIAARQGVVRFRGEKRAGSDPAAEILDFADDHGIDLIVVGSRGRGRLSGLLLGSVSQKLAAKWSGSSHAAISAASNKTGSTRRPACGSELPSAPARR